jgi:transglutaminase-like putative cysteine protease
VRAYPTYNSGGWTTQDTTVEPVSLDPFEFFDDEEDIRVGVDYYVDLAAATSYMFLPSDNPYYIDVSTEVETHDEAPFPGDLITLRPQERLGRNDSYAGTFIPAIFTERALRATGQDHPEWVTDWYLKLPDSLPARVNDLATALTEGAIIPYDKATAIEGYLRTLAYGPSPTAPAYDGDWVDLFLFQTRVGHSDHFSSSMAVMLRAVGIPSRIVSGFGPGMPDIETRTFEVTGMDLHSWPEAFFPGLGWVEFEPSPIYSLRPRAVEDLVGFDQAFLLSGLGGVDQEPITNRGDTDKEPPLVDPGGGRLPGGEGLRPIPLTYSPSPLSTSGALLWALAAAWAAGTWLVVRRLFLVLPGPQAAYTQLRRTANLLGMVAAEAQTPLEFGRVLAAAVPDAGSDVALICETFSRTRYGGGELSRWDGLRVRLAWLRVRRALTRRSFG